mmetsp:Transcript_15046/g.49354  ORF Transcript_15046/g.49354 Transcript_15046/m.49354 type:complete len:218 (+) Transcript_15046:1633-2286(+)
MPLRRIVPSLHPAIRLRAMRHFCTGVQNNGEFLRRKGVHLFRGSLFPTEHPSVGRLEPQPCERIHHVRELLRLEGVHDSLRCALPPLHPLLPARKGFDRRACPKSVRQVFRVKVIHPALRLARPQLEPSRARAMIDFRTRPHGKRNVVVVHQFHHLDHLRLPPRHPRLTWPVPESSEGQNQSDELAWTKGAHPPLRLVLPRAQPLASVFPVTRLDQP